jgi:hypothetical protein
LQRDAVDVQAGIKCETAPLAVALLRAAQRDVVRQAGEFVFA